MIEARDFIDAVRDKGFRFYAGVPCSYIKPFINYVIEDPRLTYISSANEGDAIASALGSVLGGQPAVAMMQNSGLGNAVNPLTSLAWVFHLPVLLIVTLRGDPEFGDEPQHELMGGATGSLLEVMDIAWELFPGEPGELGPALERAYSHMGRAGRPYAFVMRKGTIAPFELTRRHVSAAIAIHEGCRSVYKCCDIAQRPSREDVLRRVRERTPLKGTVVIATTGYTGRELYALGDRANQLYMVGSMGCASSLGLGLSLARRDLRVVVVDGDGAALMRMGNFATIGAYGRENLIHLLLDNEMHESTGGQGTVSGSVSFAGVAAACGYGFALEGDSADLVDQLFERENVKGPRFAQIKIRPGTPKNIPRPSLSPPEIKTRLMNHIAAI